MHSSVAHWWCVSRLHLCSCIQLVRCVSPAVIAQLCAKKCWLRTVHGTAFSPTNTCANWKLLHSQHLALLPYAAAVWWPGCPGGCSSCH
jgi:hypothetical protein